VAADAPAEIVPLPPQQEPQPEPEPQPQPEPEPDPGLEVRFLGLGPYQGGAVLASFMLRVKNPQSAPIRLASPDISLSLDGEELPGSAPVAAQAWPMEILPGAELEIPLGFPLDVELLILRAGEAEAASKANASGEQRLSLGLRADCVLASGVSLALSTQAEGAFPRVREPLFRIASIKIKRAELINTRLQVRVEVENPNVFPVDLSRFSYELYGSGRFWADGSLAGLLKIPGKGTARTELALVMNFINMKRELLDQIVALKEVSYRFAGEASVATPLDYIPAFRMGFDKRGNSAVVE
jgi:LEA14-like dessication related protein